MTVMLLAGVVLISMVVSSPRGGGAVRGTADDAPKSDEAYHILPGDAAVASSLDFTSCTIKPAVAPPHRVTPTFTASYPGSGAKMTWNLIEAITGIFTGDDFSLNGASNIVSIKTHYPHPEGRAVPGAENIPRAILLLRHPLNSIPSYFNYLYEAERNLPGHSTRAPIEEWIKWRDANFDEQLVIWRKHTEYWMDHFAPVNRLVMSYERMTGDETGPLEATRMAEFLSRNGGVTTCPPEEIPCIWHKIVKYKARRRLMEAKPDSKRSGPKYVPPYTEQQRKDMILMLSALLERYRDDPQLAPVLVGYIDEVARREEEQASQEQSTEMQTEGQA